MTCPHCNAITLASHCASAHCLWSRCADCHVVVDTDGQHFHDKLESEKACWDARRKRIA